MNIEILHIPPHYYIYIIICVVCIFEDIQCYVEPETYKITRPCITILKIHYLYGT